MRPVTTCAAMLAFTLIGSACARSRLGEPERAADPGKGLIAGAGGWSDSAAAGDAAAMDMAGAAGRPPDVPDAVRDLPSIEVWTGQLWSTMPVLCDPEDPWHGPLVVQPAGYVEPVALFLDRGADSTRPSGVIAFGRGELPSDPGDAPFVMGDSESFWVCSVQLPSRGGVYTLRSARRSAERLTFEIAPAEIWSEWCGGDVSACRACRDCFTDWVGVVVVDLVVRDDEMQGPTGASWFGTRSELRLRRVR